MASYLSLPPRPATREVNRRLREFLLVTVVLLVLACAVFAGAYLGARDRNVALDIIDNGARGEGRVIGKDWFQDSEGGSHYYITYQFLVNDVPFERRGEVGYADYYRLDDGSSIEVAYDPIIPGDSYLVIERNTQSAMGFLIFLLAVGTLFGAAGYFSAYQYLRLRKLWRHGEETIVDEHADGIGKTEYFYACRGRTIRIDDRKAVENLSVVRDNGKPVLLVDPSCPSRWQPLSRAFLPDGAHTREPLSSRTLLPSVPRAENREWQKGFRMWWGFPAVLTVIAMAIAWFAAPALQRAVSFRQSAIRAEAVVIERSASLVTYQARGLRNAFQISPSQISLWPLGARVPVLIHGSDMRAEAEVSLYPPLAALIITAILVVLAALFVIARVRRRRTAEALWKYGVETYAEVTSDSTYEDVRMIQYRFVHGGQVVAGRRHFASTIAPVLAEGANVVVVLVNPGNIRQNRLILTNEV